MFTYYQYIQGTPHQIDLICQSILCIQFVCWWWNLSEWPGFLFKTDTFGHDLSIWPRCNSYWLYMYTGIHGSIFSMISAWCNMFIMDTGGNGSQDLYTCTGTCIWPMPIIHVSVFLWYQHDVICILQWIWCVYSSVYHVYGYGK